MAIENDPTLLKKLIEAERLQESALAKCDKAKACGQDVDALIATHDEIGKQLQSMRQHYFSESERMKVD